MLRRVRKADIPAIQRFYEKVGYGPKCPDIKRLRAGRVILEAGRVVGFVGVELEANVIGIFDPGWKSPHRRVRAFAEAHLPLAKDLKRLSVVTANIYPHPMFKNFGRRLSRMGWSRLAQDVYRMKVDECLRALSKRGR